MIRVVALPSSSGATACGSGASYSASIWSCVRSTVKPVSVSPKFWPGLPITAVAVTRPSTLKLIAAWFPLGSVISAGAEDPVVVHRRDRVAHRVGGLRHQQVVGVIADRGGVPERVLHPARQEEVQPRLVKLLRRGRRAGGVVGPPARDPPGAVSVQVGVAAAIRRGAAEHAGRIGQQRGPAALVDRSDQPRSEREVVYRPGQCQGLYGAQWEQRPGIGRRRAEIIRAVVRACLGDQPPVRLARCQPGVADVLVGGVVLSVGQAWPRWPPVR